MVQYGTYRAEREDIRELEKRLNRYALDMLDEMEGYDEELCDLAIGTGYGGGAPFSFSSHAKASAKLKTLKRAIAVAITVKLLAGFRAEWGKGESRADAMAEYVLRERYHVPKTTIASAKSTAKSAMSPAALHPSASAQRPSTQSAMSPAALHPSASAQRPSTQSAISPATLQPSASAQRPSTQSAMQRAFAPAASIRESYEKAARSRWSARVWNLTEQHIREMESAISVTMQGGLSAQKLARAVQPYLNEPNRLYRRIRDQYGNLALSKAAKDYHPGRGVYRSSHANAMRLARSEINMAYRLSEQYRWRNMAFVVGYEIRISYSRHRPDICDDLAGRYPLNFLWTGWHPNCLCTCIPVFMSPEEYGEGLTREDSESYVSAVPKNFTDWVSTNSDRIANASSRGTLPFFLRDNPTHYQI